MFVSTQSTATTNAKLAGLNTHSAVSANATSRRADIPTTATKTGRIKRQTTARTRGIER